MNRTKTTRAIAALVALAGALMGVALAPPSQAQTGGQEVATTTGKAVGGSRVIEEANGAAPGITLPALTLADAEALVAAAQAGDSAAGAAVLEAAGLDIEAVARATDAAASPQAVVNSAGPAPTVELPPTGGGPLVETLASLDLTSPDPDGTTLATNLEVGTEGRLGPDGFAEAAAHLENVNRPEPNGEETAAAGARPLQDFGVAGYYQADAVDAECRADADGVTATTTITNGQPRDDFIFTALLGVAAIPTNPSPNQTLGALDLSLPIGGEGLFFTIKGFLIANEQTQSGSTLMVNATHGLLAFKFTGVTEGGAPIDLTLFSSETIYGTVHCGVTLTEGAQAPAAQGPVAARPTFTG